VLSLTLLLHISDGVFTCWCVLETSYLLHSYAPLAESLYHFKLSIQNITYSCWNPHFFLICRELQKATCNFTTLLGQGAFGPVYKADMSSGEILAVKVLSNNSKQGEKEFHNEVKLTDTCTVWFGPTCR